MTDGIIQSDDLKGDTDIKFTRAEDGRKYISVDDLTVFLTRFSIGMFQLRGEDAYVVCSTTDMIIEKIKEMADAVDPKL